MKVKKFIPQEIKNVYHFLRSFFVALFFGFPARKIKIIGVTGTNGKTTTVQMIWKILQKAGFKTAVFSTINFKIGRKEWVNKTKYTTDSAIRLQKFIKRAVDRECKYLVLEVSSHALDQYRVWGIEFDVVVITNVTREHLDYHGTMENYRKTKAKLFYFLKNVWPSFKANVKKVAVVNGEMEKPQEFLNFGADEFFVYSKEKKAEDVFALKENLQKKRNIKIKTVIAKEIDLKLDGTEFVLKDERMKLGLVGGFNVENALAAACVGISQGVSLKTISQALSEIEKVPGRMDYVENNLGLRIVVDYALTPDSMEKLGELIEQIKTGSLCCGVSLLHSGALQCAATTEQRIINASGEKEVDFKIKKIPKVIWVLGSCGDRDRGKRPIMGEIAARYADFVIITNEDPYTEEPNQIIDEVFQGVLRAGKVENQNAFRIIDRREAIEKAIKMANAGDMVFITGKGAEETMMIGNKMIPWNDKKVVKEVLSNIG